jgi:predicted RNA-binding Zn-ribbon protein involved in translation (DUF1610 family)
MHTMVRCQDCGFEFPARGIAFGNKEAFETSSISGSALKETCPQCNRTMIISDKSGYFWKD